MGDDGEEWLRMVSQVSDLQCPCVMEPQLGGTGVGGGETNSVVELGKLGQYSSGDAGS